MKIFQHVSDIGDLRKALDEAFEIKADRYKYQALGKNKTAMLIFFNNSLRTRLSTQKAALNLGMNVIVLDVNQGAWKLETERGVIMEGDKSEHLLEAIPVMGCYCDIIGVRSFARSRSTRTRPSSNPIRSLAAMPSSVRPTSVPRWCFRGLLIPERSLRPCRTLSLNG